MSDQVIEKIILILANSRKLNGRCIAGIEIPYSSEVTWVRPVSTQKHGEVSKDQRQYEDGTEPKILDVVQVPVVGDAPNMHQQENWILAPEGSWKRIGTGKIEELAELVDSSDLWLCDASSTRCGLNDRVDEYTAKTLNDSLRLIRVNDLEYHVFAPSADFGDARRRVQARFTHRDTKYRIYVTDPVVEREFLTKNGSTYKIGTAYLTVSLAETYDGYCYKVVAGVIPA